VDEEEEAGPATMQMDAPEPTAEQSSKRQKADDVTWRPVSNQISCYLIMFKLYGCGMAVGIWADVM
jgi:hypothetical protein